MNDSVISSDKSYGLPAATLAAATAIVSDAAGLCANFGEASSFNRFEFSGLKSFFAGCIGLQSGPQYASNARI